MNKKGKIILFSSILIFIMLIIIYLCFFYNKDNNFKLNSSNKYKIETDMKILTMMDDGGSNTNIYYDIDLDNNIISKIKEDYEANLLGTPKTTINVIYKKNINSNFAKEIKLLLNEIIEKEDVDGNENDIPYTIYTMNYEKNIWNKNKIEKIKNILKEIDTL